MQACNQVQGWKPMSLDSFLDTRFSKDWSDHQLESHQSHLHHSQPGTIGSYENSKVQTNLKSASAAFLRPRPRPRPLPRPLGAPAASPWRFLQLHLWVNWKIWQKIWNHLKSEWKSKSFETDHLDACIHVLIIIYSTEYIYIYLHIHIVLIRISIFLHECKFYFIVKTARLWKSWVSIVILGFNSSFFHSLVGAASSPMTRLIAMETSLDWYGYVADAGGFNRSKGGFYMKTTLH